MATKDLHIKDARFDTRLPKEQKVLFERAARLGGFRSLTDFVIATVQKRAKEIISERERVIASQKDSEIFFEAITNPSSPNKDLIEATNDFKALFS
jgi:uncharacterized protein (DUF1778 family)